MLRPKPHTRGGISRDILQMAKRKVTNEELQHSASRYKVQGIDVRGITDDPVDLLSDDLTFESAVACAAALVYADKRWSSRWRFSLSRVPRCPGCRTEWWSLRKRPRGRRKLLLV